MQFRDSSVNLSVLSKVPEAISFPASQSLAASPWEFIKFQVYLIVAEALVDH